MYQIYLFCLVLAGGLAVLSAFGDLTDTDALDMDLDAGVDLDTGTGVDADMDMATEGPGDSGFDWARILSLRGLLYAVFGFGLAGTLQVWLLDASPAGLVTIGTAVVAGLGLGWLTDRLVDLIRGVSTPDRVGDVGFEGCMARVLVPIREESPGRVRVLRGGRTFDVRALPHGRPESDPKEWTEVIVVEVRDGMALVVPDTEGDLELGSGSP